MEDSNVGRSSTSPRHPPDHGSRRAARARVSRGTFSCTSPSIRASRLREGARISVRSRRAVTLEKLGVPIRHLFTVDRPHLETARFCSHLFGMSREGLELARVARQRRVPVVLSPICWYEPRALAALEHGPLRKLASLAAWGLRLEHGPVGADLEVRAPAAGRFRLAQFAAPRRISSFVSLRFPLSESVSCPTGPCHRSRRLRRRCFIPCGERSRSSVVSAESNRGRTLWR